MRVQMPEIKTAERWKKARIVEIKTEAEAASLVAAGGVLLPEAEATPPAKTKAAK